MSESYVLFRHDFVRDTWETVAHVKAESAERAILIHVRGEGSVPILGNYVAVLADELSEFLRPRLEVRVGLELTSSQPEKLR